MKCSWTILGIVIIIVISNTNLSAQNLLITDYKVPVSSARSFSIDLNANYATIGSELTTDKGNIGAVYKNFYESLPYAYSLDSVGAFSRNKGAKQLYNYNIDVEGQIKKYIWTTHDLFGSIKLHSAYFKDYDRPPTDLTVGLGCGRFVNVTPLAKAVRVEDFFLSENLLYDDLPAPTMIQFGQVIERQSEFESNYGSTYKVHWYEEMAKLIRASGMLKGEQIDAIGILRMDDVLFRQKVSDRFYGWDATLGIKRELLTATKEQKAKSAADITVRYSHPLGWRSQWNERLIANSPMDKELFTKAYDLTIHSDFTYEMTNRIDFALNHSAIIKREKRLTDFEHLFTNSLRISFVFYIENSVNLVTNMQLNKTSETAITTNFVLALNYRVF
ncbi:hypothetical protein FJZ31_22925 [Candidatus Poribacteria bacterium]|nr:hypothetical protein [Candidatus Poribacteria bacterium]